MRSRGENSLGFGAMNTHPDGSMMSRAEILRERERRGLCMTCEYEPVQCFDTGRGVLRSRRAPLTIPGKVQAGICLMCNPLQQQQQQQQQEEEAAAEEGRGMSKKKKKNKGRRRLLTPPRFGRSSGVSKSEGRSSQVGGDVCEGEQTEADINVVLAEWEAQGALVADVAFAPAPAPAAPAAPSEDEVTDENEGSPTQPTDGAAPPPTQREQEEEEEEEEDKRPESGETVEMPAFQDCQQPAEQDSAPLPTPPQTGSVAFTDLKDAVDSLLACEIPEMDIDTIYAISSAMDDHPSDKDIQAYGISKFLLLARKGNLHKDTIMYSSALASVLGAMSSALSNPQIQENGSGILWSLAINPNNRTTLTDFGACARIIDALTTHPSSHLVARNALGAARSLSAFEHAKLKFAQVDAARTIADVMSIQTSSCETQAFGCTVLSNLAVNLRTKQVAAVSSFEIDAILSAMDAHTTSITVQKEGCFALKNLSFSAANIDTMRTNSRSIQLSPLLDSAKLHFPAECAKNVDVLLARIAAPTTRKTNEAQRTPYSVSHTANDDTMPSSEDQACKAIVEASLKLSVPLSSQSTSEALFTIASAMSNNTESTYVQTFALQSLEAVYYQHFNTMSSNTPLLSAITSAIVRHAPRSVDVAAHGCRILHGLTKLGGEKCRARLARHRSDARDDNEDSTCIGALVVALRAHHGVDKVQLLAIETISLLSEFEDSQTPLPTPLLIRQKSGFVRTMALVTSSDTSSENVKNAGRNALQLIRNQSRSQLIDHAARSQTKINPAMDSSALGDYNVLLDAFASNNQ